MTTAETLKIGFMSPTTRARPHFASFQRIVPADVTLVFGELGLVRTALTDLKDRMDAILAATVAGVREGGWDGVIVPGAPVELQNAGLRERLVGELSVPFTTALGAAADALHAFGARDVLVMTPFNASMNALLTDHLSAAGFNAACAELGFSNENEALEIGPPAVFDMARGAVKAAGRVEAIYFQGAVLDPLAIIDDMEREFGVPVLASNPTMLWSILSKLGRSYRIEGAGRLLVEWPAG